MTLFRSAGLALALLIMNFFNVIAQQFSFKHYTTRDGLPHANVFRIFQDKQGFIWFSTDDGLSRFDSKTFTNYRREEGLEKSSIMSVSEDGQGHKYINTYGGGIYEMAGSTLKKVIPDTGKLPGKTYFSFPRGNDVWVIAQDIVQKLYKISGGKVEQMDIKDRNHHDVVFYTGQEAAGNVFFGTSHGIFLLDSQNNIIPYLPGLVQGMVGALAADKSGSLWIAQQGKILQLRGSKIVRTIPVEAGMAVSDILIDRHQEVWVAVLGKGVCKLEPDRLVSTNSELGITTYVINDLFEDNEGNIWIATHGEGIFKVGDRNIARYPLSKDHLNVYCTSITPYKDGLLISSIGTISTLGNKTLQAFPVDLLLSSYYIYFLKAWDRYIYIGTPYGLIAKSMEPPFKETIIKQHGKYAKGIISILKDHRGQIWAGGYKGLYKVIHNELAEVENMHPGIGRVNVIMQDSEYTIWLGTENGLYHNKTGRWQYIPVQQAEKPRFVTCIYEDRQKRLWIGTDEGLMLLQNNRLIPLPSKKLKVNDIAENGQQVWIAASDGLYSLRDDMVLEKYNTGSFSDEPLSLYTTDSILYVGTVAGLLEIKNKSQNPDAAAVPSLYITTAAMGDKTVITPDNVSLPYHSNRLTINYIGLNYRSPELTEYRYRINRLNNRWTVTTNTSVELAGLPEGSYIFELSCRKEGGAWSNSVFLPVVVATPFWKMWWFIAAAALLVTTILILGSKIYIQRRERKKRHLLDTQHKMMHLKQQALHAMMNPHFIFNCMNSIQHYMNEHDSDAANEYLSQFARLIRLTMEYSTESFIHLDKEIDRLKLYLSLEQLRFGEDLTFELDVDEDIPMHEITIPNMIIQPFLENAIWHGIMPQGGCGKINISIKKAGQSDLKLSILDNGVGLYRRKPDTSTGKSYGMDLIRERLKLLNETQAQVYTMTAVEVVNPLSQEAEGTLIELILPI